MFHSAKLSLPVALVAFTMTACNATTDKSGNVLKEVIDVQYVYQPIPGRFECSIREARANASGKYHLKQSEDSVTYTFTKGEYKYEIYNNETNQWTLAITGYGRHIMLFTDPTLGETKDGMPAFPDLERSGNQDFDADETVAQMLRIFEPLPPNWIAVRVYAKNETDYNPLRQHYPKKMGPWVQDRHVGKTLFSYTATKPSRNTFKNPTLEAAAVAAAKGQATADTDKPKSKGKGTRRRLTERLHLLNRLYDDALRA